MPASQHPPASTSQQAKMSNKPASASSSQSTHYLSTFVKRYGAETAKTAARVNTCVSPENQDCFYGFVTMFIAKKMLLSSTCGESCSFDCNQIEHEIRTHFATHKNRSYEGYNPEDDTAHISWNTVADLIRTHCSAFFTNVRVVDTPAVFYAPWEHYDARTDIHFTVIAS